MTAVALVATFVFASVAVVFGGWPFVIAAGVSFGVFILLRERALRRRQLAAIDRGRDEAAARRSLRLQHNVAAELTPRESPRIAAKATEGFTTRTHRQGAPDG